MKKSYLLTLVLFGVVHVLFAQDVLPFPPTPTASEAGRTMQESTNKRRVDAKHLPADTPNILIILIDDAGSTRYLWRGGTHTYVI